MLLSNLNEALLEELGILNCEVDQNYEFVESGTDSVKNIKMPGIEYYRGLKRNYIART